MAGSRRRLCYTPDAMGSRLLRALALLAYALLTVVVFVLAAYTSFSLFVRGGVTSVPEVVGLSRADAANLLADKGLLLRRVAEKGRYDDKVAAGRVLRQVPDARTFVKRGSGVDIVLSLGPQRIAVPDLTQKALPAAQLTLSASGLAVGRTLTAFAVGKEPGTVLEQDPDQGTEVAPASPVDLLLASATPSERYIMPDLVYRHYDDIRAFFERQKFRLGSVKYERYEGVAAGTILRQFPLPGHPLAREDSVSLVVATAEGVSG
ncbi:MAG TPA: PASTA domain-containing protein [Thermoanaerobaculia bacterium]|nr:PASTA domain-containing protein [Thermoanaerobaculia bacterium]